MTTEKHLSAIDELCTLVMDQNPKASLIYVRIYLALAEGPHRIVDLCVEFAENPNDSGINFAVNNMQELGIVEIDRSVPKNEGYSVKLTQEWKLIK